MAETKLSTREISEIIETSILLDANILSRLAKDKPNEI